MKEVIKLKTEHTWEQVLKWYKNNVGNYTSEFPMMANKVNVYNSNNEIIAYKEAQLIDDEVYEEFAIEKELYDGWVFDGLEFNKESAVVGKAELKTPIDFNRMNLNVQARDGKNLLTITGDCKEKANAINLNQKLTTDESGDVDGVLITVEIKLPVSEYEANERDYVVKYRG